jgi:hypothetical protein
MRGPNSDPGSGGRHDRGRLGWGAGGEARQIELARLALQLSGHHARADRARDDDRLRKQIRRAAGLGGCRRRLGIPARACRGDDFPSLEAHLAARGADRDELGARLDEVSGENRGQKLDRFVRSKQSFVAVEPDE